MKTWLQQLNRRTFVKTATAGATRLWSDALRTRYVQEGWLPLAREKARRPEATEMDRKVYEYIVQRRAAFHPQLKLNIRRQLLQRQTAPESQILEARASEPYCSRMPSTPLSLDNKS